jgi:3-deoxy-7-phosphoheptulonate synthase
MKFGLGIVTEAIDDESLALVEKYADVIQIGARNMQNFSLLKSAGRARKPVLLKRGMSATLDEFLMAAEYILSEGNYNVILCERGVRTFSDHTRNTLDLSIIPAVQLRSHLPIVVDPSARHGTPQQSAAAFARRGGRGRRRNFGRSPPRSRPRAFRRARNPSCRRNSTSSFAKSATSPPFLAAH